MSQVYTLARDVEGMLRARKFPVRVEYGPKRVDRDVLGAHSHVIVFERDRARGDTVIDPKGARVNPRTPRVMALGVKATIYARSSLEGANVQDHEDECDRIVDGLVTALSDWGAEARAPLTLQAGRYLSRDDLGGVEGHAGVAYELTFTVGRGVARVDWSGDARPVKAASGVRNRTDVRIQGHDPEDPPAIGCNAIEP